MNTNARDIRPGDVIDVALAARSEHTFATPQQCCCGYALMPATEPIALTLDQVAALTGFAPSTLLKLCRAKKVEHVKLGNTLSMTRQQVDALLAKFTVRAKAEFDPNDADRQRVLAEMTRKHGRAA